MSRLFKVNSAGSNLWKNLICFLLFVKAKSYPAFFCESTQCSGKPWRFFQKKNSNLFDGSICIISLILAVLVTSGYFWGWQDKIHTLPGFFVGEMPPPGELVGIAKGSLPTSVP